MSWLKLQLDFVVTSVPYGSPFPKVDNSPLIYKGEPIPDLWGLFPGQYETYDLGWVFVQHATEVPSGPYGKPDNADFCTYDKCWGASYFSYLIYDFSIGEVISDADFAKRGEPFSGPIQVFDDTDFLGFRYYYEQPTYRWFQISVDNNNAVVDISETVSSITEGDSGQQTVEFEITIDEPLDEDLTVEWEMKIDGTRYTNELDLATLDAFPKQEKGASLILAGETSAKISFQVKGDELPELDEALEVEITRLIYNPDTLNDERTVIIGNGSARTVVLNDDGPYTLDNVLKWVYAKGEFNAAGRYIQIIDSDRGERAQPGMSVDEVFRDVDRYYIGRLAAEGDTNALKHILVEPIYDELKKLYFLMKEYSTPELFTDWFKKFVLQGGDGEPSPPGGFDALMQGYVDGLIIKDNDLPADYFQQGSIAPPLPVEPASLGSAPKGAATDPGISLLPIVVVLDGSEAQPSMQTGFYTWGDPAELQQLEISIANYSPTSDQSQILFNLQTSTSPVVTSSGSDFINNFSDSSVDSGGGDDVIFGLVAAQNIVSGDGNDMVIAGDYDDIISAGMGDDRVVAGLGADSVDGGGDDDTIDGGDGNDTIQGGAGSDSVDGGLGTDNIFGQSAADLLNGGEGDDHVRGGAGIDTLHGDGGNDNLIGNTASDVLYGDAGADSLFGSEGKDSLYGGDDDDLLRGGTGADLLDGGDGDDEVYGSAGSDELQGGDGDDYLNGATGADYIDGGRGNDTLIGSQGLDTLIGGFGDDSLSGGSLTDTLDGKSGNDMLNGGKGADIFVFRSGGDNDVIEDFELDVDLLSISLALTGGVTDSKKIIADYGDDTTGVVIFDFGGGDTITLSNLTSLAGLSDSIGTF